MKTILGNYPTETCMILGSSMDALPFVEEESKEAAGHQAYYPFRRHEGH